MTRKSKNVNENSTTACPEESVKLVKRFRPKEQLIVEFKGETKTDPWEPLFLLPLKQTIENPIKLKRLITRSTIGNSPENQAIRTTSGASRGPRHQPTRMRMNRDRSAKKS